MQLQLNRILSMALYRNSCPFIQRNVLVHKILKRVSVLHPDEVDPGIGSSKALSAHQLLHFPSLSHDSLDEAPKDDPSSQNFQQGPCPFVTSPPHRTHVLSSRHTIARNKAGRWMVKIAITDRRTQIHRMHDGLM